MGAGWLLLVGLFPAVAAEKTPTSAPSAGVQIVQLTNRLRVEINGQLFTEYYFKDVPRPFCYPLLGPDNLPLMRNWPMKDVPGEDKDHKHHRSMWFTHGSVNGLDFWSEDKDFGKIVHDGFVQVASGTDAGVIKARNKWVAKDGTVVCTDERTLRIYNRPATERLLDFEITIHASNGELTFGDTKEGTMAVRLNETMRLKPNKENAGKPTGHIVNSEGVARRRDVGQARQVVRLLWAGRGQDRRDCDFRQSGEPAVSDVVARPGLRFVRRESFRPA